MPLPTTHTFIMGSGGEETPAAAELAAATRKERMFQVNPCFIGLIIFRGV